MRAGSLAVAALFILGTGARGEAGLIGDTISAEWVAVNTTAGSGVFATDSFIVDSSIEMDCPMPPGGTSSFCAQFGVPATMDFRDSSIRFDAYLTSPPSTGYAPGDFNGWVFSSLDLGVPGGIIGVAINTNIPGLDSSRVSFSADSVSINMQHLAGEPELHPFAEFTLLTQSVPEPATGLLAVVGIGVALVRRRWQSPNQTANLKGFTSPVKLSTSRTSGCLANLQV